MSYDLQPPARRWAALRADQQLVDQAAAQLRRQAIRDGDAGAPGQHLAFTIALLLEELARHAGTLDDELRWRVVTACRTLLNDCPRDQR